jgi:cell division transport system permease protein
VIGSRARQEAGASLQGTGRRAGWLMQHRHALRLGLRYFFGRPLGSFVVALVMAVTLAVPTLLHTLLASAERMAQGLDLTPRISLFLRPDQDEKQAERLAAALRGQPGIASVRVISRAEALAEFRATAGYGDPVEYLGENPLPVVLVVAPRQIADPPEGAERLLAALKARREVESALDEVDWVRRLLALLDLGRRVLVTVATLLGCGALLAVGIAVRLLVVGRQEEIRVGKLLGASVPFLRRPFLYSGVCHGLFGALLGLWLVGLGGAVLDEPVRAFAGSYRSAISVAGPSLQEALTLLLIGCVLGLLAAWVAASRKLRALDPGPH